MDYYIDETMGLLLFSNILNEFGDFEQAIEDDFLEQLNRLEAICTSDIFLILKKDIKWHGRGWNIDRIYKTIEELRRKTYVELIPLFLKSGDSQRMSLVSNVIILLDTLEIFTKNAELDNFANGNFN
jgi:hypothetical protein